MVTNIVALRISVVVLKTNLLPVCLHRYSGGAASLIVVDPQTRRKAKQAYRF
jgi:hypothetical protein